MNTPNKRPDEENQKLDPLGGIAFGIGLTLVSGVCWGIAIAAVWIARLFFWPSVFIVASGMLGAFYLRVYRKGGL